MKLDKIITEGVSTEGKFRSVDLSKAEAVSYIKKNCKQAVKFYSKNNVRLIRGLNINRASYLFTDPKKHRRRSITAHSHHIHVMALTWPKNFPRRDYSLLANSHRYMENGYPRRYGFTGLGQGGDAKVYIVFPFDNAVLAYNESYEHLFDAVRAENEPPYRHIHDINDRLVDMDVSDTSPDDMMATVSDDNRSKQLLDDYIDVLNYKKLGYRLAHINNLKPNDGEVFTESKCILVISHEADEVMDLVVNGAASPYYEEDE